MRSEDIYVERRSVYLVGLVLNYTPVQSSPKRLPSALVLALGLIVTHEEGRIGLKTNACY